MSEYIFLSTLLNAAPPPFAPSEAQRFNRVKKNIVGAQNAPLCFSKKALIFAEYKDRSKKERAPRLS